MKKIKLIPIILIILISISYAQPIDSISIALVDSSGNVNPIFNYSDNVWHSFYDVSIRNMFQHNQWYLYEFRKPKLLNVDTTLFIIERNEERYYARFGFKSNHKKQNNLTNSKFIGLAVSEIIKIDMFNILPRNSEIWKNVNKYFNSRLIPKSKYKKYYNYLSQYYGESLEINFSGLELWQSKSNAMDVFYFKVINEFGNNGCNTHIYYHGWLKELNGEYIMLFESIGIDGCDYKLTPIISPLSLIQINNEQYVLVEKGQRDTQIYYIYKLEDINKSPITYFGFDTN